MSWSRNGLVRKSTASLHGMHRHGNIAVPGHEDGQHDFSYLPALWDIDRRGKLQGSGVRAQNAARPDAGLSLRDRTRGRAPRRTGSRGRIFLAICDLQGDFQKLQGEPILFRQSFLMFLRCWNELSRPKEQGEIFGIAGKSSVGIANGAGQKDHRQASARRVDRRNPCHWRAAGLAA